jgi:hypothetical protein
MINNPLHEKHNHTLEARLLENFKSILTYSILFSKQKVSEAQSERMLEIYKLYKNTKLYYAVSFIFLIFQTSTKNSIVSVRFF